MTGTRSIIIHPAAQVLRREVGAQAWSALEVLAAGSGATSPSIVVTSVRALAGVLGVSKNTAARALAVLRAAGLIEPQQARRSTGTFDAGSYTLTIPANVIDITEANRPTESIANEPSPPRVRNGTRRRDDLPAQLSLLDAG